MYVPVVVPPTTSYYGRTTVVNKTIVYQDTVLNLKEKGVNLNVTKIKVEISSFENCMNTIFESNPGVVFNTVQYSYKNEEAIFYTDKKISTEKWEKRNEVTLKAVPKALTLIESIEEVLKYEDSLDPECVSAFDVWSVYRDIRRKREALRKKIENKINAKLKAISEGYFCYLYDFNYSETEVGLYIKTYRENHFYFRKNESDLYLYKEDAYVSFDVLALFGAEIEEYYDYCYALKEVEKQMRHNIKVNRFEFYCNFFASSVSIDNSSETFMETFEVNGSTFDDEGFECNCNSNNVKQALNGRENEFAKKIMVPIRKCPEWMQEKLSEIRKQQIENIVKERIQKEEAEKELARKLAKKQKKREFWGKIFPFIK